jgi:hypothetical protein
VEKANLEHRVKQLEADAHDAEEELKLLRQQLASVEKASVGVGLRPQPPPSPRVWGAEHDQSHGTSARGAQTAWGGCMTLLEVGGCVSGEAAAAAKVGRGGPRASARE